MTSTAILTPFDQGVVDLGNSWWKRILPVGEVEYKGRMLHFTKDYLAGLVAAFKDGAYDQVPLQLAGADNSHTNDVERYAGTVDDFDLRSDGLYGKITPTERGEQVIRDNPLLGVSARIVEDYGRSDGKFFPRAIQHVLATLDPRIPGLGGWQAVEASNDANVTIDLSGLHFAGDDTSAAPIDSNQPETTNPEGTGSSMPDNGLTPEQRERLGQLLNLPPEQWAALTAAQAVTAPDTSGEISDADLDALLESISPEELAELEAEAEPVSVGAQAGLSAEHLMAIEMSRTQSEDALAQLREINTELDQQKFETERRRLADAGVPFYLTDLARPLLEGAGHVIEMSNGTAVDAGQIMRKVLGEVGRAAGLLDLSDELGSALDEPEQHQQATAERDDLVAQAKQVMGFR